MKRKVKKLTLNRETVRRLTDEELRGVAGGDPTNGNTCACTQACPTDETCGCETVAGCGDTCRPNSAPCCNSCPGTICP